MEVNFDNLRKRLIADYNSLVQKLEISIKDESYDPTIIVDPNYIKKDLDNIRSGLVTLAFCYMKGEDGFDALDEEIKFFEFYQNEGDEESV